MRLKAAVSGLTVVVGYIAAALTVIRLIESITIQNFKIPIGFLLATISCFIAAQVAQQFIWKIEMFNFFIASSVKIALALEKKIVDDENLRLTAAFEKHPYAGKKGDPLFLQALVLIKFIAWFGVILSAGACIYYYCSL